MMTCNKCGNDNPLGRVFCVSCGSKLDLSHMTSATVTEQQQVNFFVAHARDFASLLLLIPVLLIASAFWPSLSPIGQPGVASGTSGVTRQLGVLTTIARGRAVSLEISEKDINGYLQYSRIKKTPVSSLSVRCMPGAMVARMVKPLMPPITLGSIRLEPKISYEVVCVPIGRQVGIARASIGHLRAVGPLRSIAVAPFLGLLKGGREERILGQVSEMRVEEGKLILTAGG